MAKLQDTDPMPWGKYRGDKMANIPAGYLLYLLENDKCSGDVKVYIEENKDTLEEERRKG